MAYSSQRVGMGAVVYPGGTTFRVWAPFVQKISVAGAFNAWKVEANPLASEGNGYWSVDVEGAKAGDAYKFVVNGSLWRRDPYGRIVQDGNSVIYDPTSYTWQRTFGMPGWNQLIIYQLHPLTFPDAHRAGQRVDPKKTLTHVTDEELAYLKDLGINAIELLPTSEFPGSTSWGYNPSDIFAVEGSYGGPNELKALIDRAHGHGIAVILDVVYNHLGPSETATWQFTGSHEHYWIEGETDDDMGGIYFYQDWRAHTPWGGKNRPDYGREEVRRYLRDNVMMWLDEYQADGVRVDAVAYIRNVNGNNNSPGDDIADGWSTLQWITNEIRRCKGWKISIAEDLKNNAWITKDTGSGGAGFGSQWSTFVHTLRPLLVAPRDEDRSMTSLRDALYARDNFDAFQRVVYGESHDECAKEGGRLTDGIAPGDAESWVALKRASLGAGIVLSAPGIPMLFMGQEIGEWREFSVDGIAYTVDWYRDDRLPGLPQLFRDMIRLRADWFNQTRGLRGPHVNVFHVNEKDKLIAFHRWDHGGACDDTIVVANLANRAYPSYWLGLPSGGRWRCRLNSDCNCYKRLNGHGPEPMFGGHPTWDIDAVPERMDGLGFKGDLSIGPYTLAVFSQDR
jgi:1,4-alpha-glucan branching enzyme